MAGLYVLECEWAKSYVMVEEIKEGQKAYDIDTDEMVFDGSEWLVDSDKYESGTAHA